MNPSKTLVRVIAPSLLALATLTHPASSQAATAAPATLAECPSGNFCVWSGTNFTGGMQRISTTNAYKSISLTATKSYYNNRSRRTWLHEDPDGGGLSVCINPGVSKGSTTGWQTTAEAAYLATITNC